MKKKKNKWLKEWIARKIARNINEQMLSEHLFYLRKFIITKTNRLRLCLFFNSFCIFVCEEREREREFIRHQSPNCHYVTTASVSLFPIQKIFWWMLGFLIGFHNSIWCHTMRMKRNEENEQEKKNQMENNWKQSVQK